MILYVIFFCQNKFFSREYFVIFLAFFWLIYIFHCMKKLSIILCITGMIFIISFFLQKNTSMCFPEIQQTTWNMELALTPDERIKWLTGRDTLCETCGMLFVFWDMRARTFWMKNTHIPLDIYFYNAEGQLVDGIANMRPEKETTEPMQYTSSPAQYVVEVPGNSHRFLPEYFDPRKCLKK